MAGSYDFTIYQGADWNITLTWIANGSVVDVTSYHAHLQARPSYASQSSTIFIDISDQTSGITLGGTAGTITLALTAAQTAALSFTQASYDLKLTSGSGAVTRLLQGSISLSPEVTV